MTRKEIERRIQSSAVSVVRASVREIDRMIRDGLTLEEILERLRSFHLSRAEADKLRRTLEDGMNDIVRMRESVVSELSGAEIEIVKAASQVSFPKLQKTIRDELTDAVQKAIGLRSGMTALMHDLRERKLAGARTLANTSLAQFNNELTFTIAEQSGTDKFLYSGPSSSTTRPFCRKHVGKVYTLKQIEAMDNGQGIPVRTSCGGYNCRHMWIAALEG